MTRTTIAIANRIEEMARVFAEVDRFAAACGLPLGLVNELNVVLDEVLNNIISYAYDDGGEHLIEVELALDDGEVTVVVSDDGRPFDPLRAPAPAPEPALAARRVGGLGIHFVRSLTDRCNYARAGGRNRLTMKKRVAQRDREG